MKLFPPTDSLVTLSSDRNTTTHTHTKKKVKKQKTKSKPVLLIDRLPYIEMGMEREGGWGVDGEREEGMSERSKGRKDRQTETETERQRER